MDDLVERLVLAIDRSLDEAALSGDSLVGYALLIDADLQSVYGASIAKRAAEEAADDGILFMPVDWPCEYHSHEFEAAGAMLATIGRAHLSQPYEARVQAVSHALVAALKRKQSGPLLNCFTTLMCADGGGAVWQRVEREAVRELNDAQLYSAWVEWVGDSG